MRWDLDGDDFGNQSQKRPSSDFKFHFETAAAVHSTRWLVDWWVGCLLNIQQYIYLGSPLFQGSFSSPPHHQYVLQPHRSKNARKRENARIGDTYEARVLVRVRTTAALRTSRVPCDKKSPTKRLAIRLLLYRAGTAEISPGGGDIALWWRYRPGVRYPRWYRVVPGHVLGCGGISRFHRYVNSSAAVSCSTYMAPSHPTLYWNAGKNGSRKSRWCKSTITSSSCSRRSRKPHAACDDHYAYILEQITEKNVLLIRMILVKILQSTREGDNAVEILRSIVLFSIARIRGYHGTPRAINAKVQDWLSHDRFCLFFYRR